MMIIKHINNTNINSNKHKFNRKDSILHRINIVFFVVIVFALLNMIIGLYLNVQMKKQYMIISQILKEIRNEIEQDFILIQ